MVPRVYVHLESPNSIVDDALWTAWLLFGLRRGEVQEGEGKRGCQETRKMMRRGGGGSAGDEQPFKHQRRPTTTKQSANINSQKGCRLPNPWPPRRPHARRRTHIDSSEKNKKKTRRRRKRQHKQVSARFILELVGFLGVLP